MTRTMCLHFFRFALAASVLAILVPLVATADELALDARQSQIYATICLRCHVRPDIGAPVVGDEAAWAPRRAKGADVLLEHTITGFRDMPPLGTCAMCDEDDFRRLVAVLAGLPPSPPDAMPEREADPQP